ncbi:hypothetical protein HH310_08180 [Actinoplanes sp. TBRC 11911]|uniref:hypothetical protein n=1 Tax=Actinoplanes sp. TBRC 11911 TaxID=2729386 RepID=UPI00145C5FFB|nr:hypothetical protein [Actinoplanes sp. TBRC 11911]NMO51163.1 hypothetical protein [Actinoplanes sp. TBRC 11911]
MTVEGVTYERRSAAPVIAPVRPRKLAKVPFVELTEGRLAGVVSSGSDPARVYVSSINAGDHGLSCRTNNNRPCGGFGGSHPCNHLRALADAAVTQYGIDRVARYLKADVAPGADDLWAGIRPSSAEPRAADVFAGFLRHLTYLELPPSTEAMPELQWFPAAGLVR